MIVTRISAINPPEGPDRTTWVREMLKCAITNNLKPAAHSAHQVSSFVVSLPADIKEAVERLAQSEGVPLADMACGLIEAARKPAQDGQDEYEQVKLAGEEKVRDILLPLLHAGEDGLRTGHIVFGEAATGTGKGNMIACLAATAAHRGDTVVVSAPLPIAWSLLDAISAIPEAARAGVALLLGRPNFVSPKRTREWALDNQAENLIAWLDSGCHPTAERLREANLKLSHPLRYLLEDALELAPELPAALICLDSADDPDECEAEALYRQQRKYHQASAITICSHHMLAAAIRTRQLRGTIGEEDSSSSIPSYIDTLIVDEAHLLESAFAAINSHGLRLRPLLQCIENDVGRGRKAAMASLSALYDALVHIDQTTKQTKSGAGDRLGSIEIELDDIRDVLESANKALGAIKTENLPTRTNLNLRIALGAINDALSGYSKLRIDLSPVRRYPMLISGRANLSKALGALWDSCSGVFLTSATLYSEGENASLIRWKLEVPKERALYLPAVHPAWITEPVTLHRPVMFCQPDDSAQWAQETASALSKICGDARGGTLVLFTSYLNVAQLRELLSKTELGERLIVQTPQQTASTCEMHFRQMHRDGKLPIWLGVGTAWTGINLSDTEQEPASDTLLTDLVIARLPVGLNRSLTHQRREKLAGFRIVQQEAVWMFRQGLGRLVRRQGVTKRNLWVLDSRLGDKKTGWIKPFNALLGRYKKGTSK